MASVTVLGLPNSRKTPGVYLSTIFGGSGASGGAAPEKLLVMGNMIAANLTGATGVTFTVTAGTEQVSGAATESPVLVVDKDDAATKFGRGSELHLMCVAAFEQYPDCPLYACPVREGGGAVKASATLTLTGTATSSGTVQLVVAGRTIEYGFASGDVATGAGGIAQKVAQAIIDNPDLPVTAQVVVATGVITITAKQGGTRGNDIKLRCYLLQNNTRVRVTTSATAAFGLTGTLSANALGSGATGDNLTNALAVIANTQYHRIAIAQTDATNINRLRDQLNTMAGTTTMLWQQGIAATLDTLTNGQTLTGDPSTGINDELIQCIWHYNSESLSGEIAAQCAAARLNGDVVVGGVIAGESQKPQTNLDGVMLKSIRVQPDVADIPIASEVETALNYGLTPLVPSAAHPGYVQIARSITTRHKNSDGALNYSVIDTEIPTVIHWMAARIRSDFQVTFAGMNLGANDADGNPPKIEGVVTTTNVRDRALFLLKEEEGLGKIRNVDALASLLTVVENPSVAGRVDCEIPIEPVPNLHIIGGNVRQVAA